MKLTKFFLQTKIALIFLGLFLTASCDQQTPFFRDDFSNVPEPFPADANNKTELENGLIIYEVDEGYGTIEANNRDVFNGYYTGRLTNGEIFDSSYKNGNDNYISISLAGVNPQTGQFLYIEGFRKGFLGMKQGGKRKVIVPPDLGYGGTTSQYANDTLVFDIEIHSFLSQ